MRKWEKDTDTKSFSLVLPLSLSLTNLHAQRERERERAASKREQVSENDASKLIEKRTFKKQLIVEMPRGNGVMDSAAACCAGGPGSIPAVGICKE